MLLLRNAELPTERSAGQRRWDVVVNDGDVAAVLPAGGGQAVVEHLRSRCKRAGIATQTEVIDARGAAVLPGLCDHHLHLLALAAAWSSVDCGPSTVMDRDGLGKALVTASRGEDGWIRGIGYHESVAGVLTAEGLDALGGSERPVRIQHRSGAMWTFNTAASAQLALASAEHPGIERDAAGRPTGRVFRADDWLRARLPRTGPPNLAAVGAELARLGVTSVVDATPDLSDVAMEAISSAHRRGDLPQRPTLLGAPLGWQGDLSTGPYKIVLTDSALQGLAEISAAVAAAHAVGRPVAVHCVTREALLLQLAVFHNVGTVPGDRIEHGSLIPAESIRELARLGVTVVTQPGFLADRGHDYLRDTAPADVQDLYRCASLLRRHVPVGLSSDAPYGPLSPWEVMAAAVNRRSRSTGVVVGPDECISTRDAVAGYLSAPAAPGGPVRRVSVGSPADLVVLGGSVADLVNGRAAVLATIIGGRVVHLGD